MARSVPNLDFEIEAAENGFDCIAGTDEAGRGPLAGPVVAAAVILDPDNLPEGVNDSKALSVARREAVYEEVLSKAQVGIGEASVAEIDELNILRASHLAMERAIAALPLAPDHILVDGHIVPMAFRGRAQGIVKGDARSASIAAASIVAKIRRDLVMWDLAQQFPGYGWEKNQGYPTKAHKEALQNLGVTPHHRRSFKPVHNILYQGKFVTP